MALLNSNAITINQPDMEKVEISLEHYHHFQKIEKEYTELVDGLLKKEGTIYFSMANRNAYYAVNPNKALKDIESERESLRNKLNYNVKQYEDRDRELHKLRRQKMPILNLSGKVVGDLKID